MVTLANRNLQAAGPSARAEVRKDDVAALPLMRRNTGDSCRITAVRPKETYSPQEAATRPTRVLDHPTTAPDPRRRQWMS
jgi:hypothetical protein